MVEKKQNKRPVRVITSIGTRDYDSVREAHKETGYAVSTIRDRCNNKSEKQKNRGFDFEWI